MTPAPELRVVLVGYGRMGRLIETLAAEYGVAVVERLRSGSAQDLESLPPADVAIDFSTAAAVPVNAPALAGRGLSLVIGTTGWHQEADAIRLQIGAMPVGVIAAPNFAIGVNLFLELTADAGRLLGGRGFHPWIHEAHHAAKKDAPSGTAIALRTALEDSFGSVDVASTRAGHIPGTHTVGFDSPAETITLTHVARDRTAFARGALEAAKWIHGRKGWFTMRDMLRGESSA